MKLRNFMYATMIACAFASCSKDDVIENGTDPVKGDASLTVTASAASTKAVVATENQPETTINDLTIFLVNDQDVVVGKQYLDNATTLTATFDGLAIGQKLHCVGFANFGKEITEAEATNAIILNTAANLGATNLPMHGVSNEVTISSNNATNVATLTLIRDLARVELTKLSLSMSSTYQDKYKGGEFSLKFKQASINSAAESVSFTSGLTKTRSTTYTAAQAFIGGLGTDWAWKKGEGEEAVNVKNTAEKAAFTTYLTNGTGSESVAEYVINTTTGLVDAGLPTLVYYVLPNANVAVQPTVLTLKGQFTVANGETENQTNINKNVESFYNIEIGNTGEISGGNYTKGSGIVANKSYKIQVIVSGEGGDVAGSKPVLTVNTVVADWDEVTQVAPAK